MSNSNLFFCCLTIILLVLASCGKEKASYHIESYQCEGCECPRHYGGPDDGIHRLKEVYSNEALWLVFEYSCDGRLSERRERDGEKWATYQFEYNDNGALITELSSLNENYVRYHHITESEDGSHIRSKVCSSLNCENNDTWMEYNSWKMGNCGPDIYEESYVNAGYEHYTDYSTMRFEFSYEANCTREEIQYDTDVPEFTTVGFRNESIANHFPKFWSSYPDLLFYNQLPPGEIETGTTFFDGTAEHISHYTSTFEYNDEDLLTGWKKFNSDGDRIRDYRYEYY